MANSGSNLRNSRAKIMLRAHYYEGYMEKKGSKDKDVEQLDLENFVSLTDDSSSKNQKEHRLILKLRSTEVKLKVENLELRELWKGFILTVVELRVPTNLTLLPGHLCMLGEALEKEKQRLAELKSSQYDRADDEEKPSCFYKVSRMEAQALLENNPSCGNLLMRPGSDQTSLSISICYIHCSQPITKHFKVKQTEKEYVLQVDPPVCFFSLTDIVDYFVMSTKYKLTPFVWNTDYEDRLVYPEVDNESGESVFQKGSILPAPLPVVPMKPFERVPPAIPTDPLPSDEEDTYEPIDEDAEYINPEPRVGMALPSVPCKPMVPSHVSAKPQNVKVKPKTPRNVTATPKTPMNVNIKPKTPTTVAAAQTIAADMSLELLEKLQIRRMKLEG
ncbi:signal-transducing adaptor protein 2 isoform X3 [Rhinatrema bivittatum]|uniref:signal-transducing adaptor protein 2 isoform X3 n=1 Tax=Rhinatrema bivittatum TaxID=194408 RepID=UPI001125F50D|nr:signal-transducing adaptor protein 2 isoform X3 [Rhinatrema bivittatum]